MEKILDKARDYILALKQTGNFTFEDIANMSGVPQQTVKNICSGKTSKNAGFDTVVSLIVSLGGDLNELIGYQKKKEIEINSTVSMKETYEMRIADLIKSYEERIEDIKELCEVRIADVQKCCDIRIADLKQNYGERIKEQREMLSKS
jgi:transcriptional regulator with XRE-family HTH domain